eukprot:CAMPEP_0196573472 /NCGR_PEP_ID=MMETSP1081-20130531/3373_1 /TAXON_ID=36882 /ORGANISM="Pyramimonas amylifera, Strain CCMP720" /LENGTH=406 /DNA_ID=CAMNT_0041891201 /DNA_START=32 /DNA_END=1252 /DNA_ORIENTATION=+
MNILTIQASNVQKCRCVRSATSVSSLETCKKGLRRHVVGRCTNSVLVHTRTSYNDLAKRNRLKTTQSVRGIVWASTIEKQGHDFPPEILDDIIKIFRTKERADWPKFMAHSDEWPQLSEFVFQRMESSGTQDGVDPDDAVEILTTLKALKKVDEEVEAQRLLLKEFLATEEEEVEALVAGRRQLIGPHFFDFVAMRVDALHTKLDQRQNLIALATKIASICDTLDQAGEDMEAADEAAQTLQKLLQVGSLEEADKMIDDLAASGGLNPALLLTTAKAYNSVKESAFTQEEVKDVMAHLYFKMKETTGRQQPVDVRILKHLLALEDPLERRVNLETAFTPGPELETPTDDFLCTKPDRLLFTIQTVLKAYDSQKNKTNLTGQAAELMQPAVIDRMREIESEIERDFM